MTQDDKINAAVYAGRILIELANIGLGIVIVILVRRFLL